MLKGYRGDNAIVLDFVRSLESLEDQTRSFRNWRRTGGERKWAAWQGLYRELERRLFAWDAKPRWSGWGYVHNASGGFLGFCRASSGAAEAAGGRDGPVTFRVRGPGRVVLANSRYVAP